MLVRHSANRVYADATPALLEAELGALGETWLAGRVRDVGHATLGGLPYLLFRIVDPEPDDLARLGLLSGLYALFRREPSGALHPVAAPAPAHLDDDLLTIPKYAGKTNELFTRLLVNLALWAADGGEAVLAPETAARPLRLVDPLSGRGTTLHQALVYGLDADGLEHDARDVDAHAAFLKTWLRRKRLKHSADLHPVRHPGRPPGRRLDVELAADKDAWKQGRRRRLRVVETDTARAVEHLGAARADLLVADLPYGVRHGAQGSDGLRRSPTTLLAEALPGWVEVLRPGGAAALAWNTRVSPRAEVVGLLADAGLEPLDAGPWRALEHRVDQAVQRDVVVARRPRRV